MPEHKHTNQLIHSSSPYLLQHAHNPVNWLEWNKESLEKAKAEDKPIILSIGYSACHWCHVMERESFENEDIAAIMNEHFVCIKVDREERPDVDQIYMDAIHAMGLQGGWPLNAFLLPDQRPFYGGTYFPPQGWTQLCNQIAQVFKEKRADLEKSADGFAKSLSQSEVEKYGLNPTEKPFSKALIQDMFLKLQEGFDLDKGGNNRAPKFPMPSSYAFLLRTYLTTGNKEALAHVERTLNHMAWGGLYDQVGGGFTRYSTDMDWFVPHFEKMLYDNAQLVSLYTEGHQVTQNPLYKETVYQTIDWLEREMLSPEGGFYSALDADSEGEEGKFYIWTHQEFLELLGADAELMIQYYGISQGNWEPNKNIPFRQESDESFAEAHGLDLDELKGIVEASKIKLLQERNKRVRPGLDDKILTGWNGLMLKGLCQAYATFGEAKFLELAKKNADFLLDKLLTDEGLKRNFKNGKASINANLEDYAAIISGLIELYQVTFEEDWLTKVQELTIQAIDQFFDKKEELFFFTQNKSEELIARKKELFDNVIPSSNSMMAQNLHQLGTIVGNQEYVDMAAQMLKRMDRILTIAPGDLSNWGSFYTSLSYPTAEIAMVGDNLEEARKELGNHFLPNAVFVGKRPDQTSALELLEGRELANEKTTFYLCYNKACQLPVNSVEELVAQVQFN